MSECQVCLYVDMNLLCKFYKMLKGTVFCYFRKKKKIDALKKHRRGMPILMRFILIVLQSEMP